MLADVEMLKFMLKKLLRAFCILDENAKSCCVITLAQCSALVEVGRADTISLNKLAEILNLDSSTMSRTVDNLVKRGYVNRVKDTQNRRMLNISLTEEGLAQFKSMELALDNRFRQIVSQIPLDKQSQVIESLSLLSTSVSKALSEVK